MRREFSRIKKRKKSCCLLLNLVTAWDLGCGALCLGEGCLGLERPLARPNIQSQLREERGETRLWPSVRWHDPHPQTSMGWTKQKNYTHFFNAFYIIHHTLGCIAEEETASESLKWFSSSWILFQSTNSLHFSLGKKCCGCIFSAKYRQTFLSFMVKC